MSPNSKNRRSIFERVKAIFRFINAQEEAFAKSRFKEVGFNPMAAEKWLNLIQFIQSQPKIRVVKTKHNTIIEKIELNYHTMMMKRIMDENLSYEERWQSVGDYFRALYTQERAGIGRIGRDLNKS